MINRKDIVGSILFKELIAVRTDTLWRMLFCLQQGQLPGINEEGATGKLDNKGAIFIPGGLIYQDVDDNEITYEAIESLDESLFREKIRESMQFDNATLLFPDGFASSVNLDSGFFTRAARRINNFKTAAFKRKRKIGRKLTIDIDANDIIHSHCPTYIASPYGSRTRISTCVSIGLIDPHMYLAYCKTEYSLSKHRLKKFAVSLDTATEHSVLSDGTVLYPPHVIVCHDTRYKENSLTGLVRILGIGRFGEFSTFTFERLNKQLMGELKRKKIEYGEEHVFAEYAGVRALGILRTYAPTNPGKRSMKYRLDVLSPEKDLNIDLNVIAECAKERYRIDDAPISL
ncbi:hypothetical protein DSCA_00500 [Desulfosarcina alkanivorans]|uniref:Uncharacterized protein n=1 Tax=Desulfosarcina alkanivorans TaxID=571177 RepID=A0A5K7YDR5_9BACT|nr:hypothetical protein [Desulfosarcina alkanivorans]BBO66120.1 hypothetical protein DSCA_00500 [Desulfosarcina alkanivorans]